MLEQTSDEIDVIFDLHNDRPLEIARKGLTSLHVVLFVSTFLSTLLAGMLQKGVNPFNEPWRFYEGLPFALTLMVILLTHELAHYFASIRHHTTATMPYFIPAPFSPVGTLGAFIKMKSPIYSRSALIDIGASGPIAGFVVSFIAVVGGLFYSRIGSASVGEGMVLGDSLLFSLLSRLIVGTPPHGQDVILNPVAFAGWIGFFLTSLNLLPIGQLDGGHIMYSIAGRWHVWISRVLVVGLLYMGKVQWHGWWFWALMMVVVGLRHPPVLFDELPIEPSRLKTSAASLFIFILTFVPSPFMIME